MTGTTLGPGDIGVEEFVFKELTFTKTLTFGLECGIGRERTVAGTLLSTMAFDRSYQCLRRAETSQRLPQSQIRAGSSWLESVLRLCLVLQKP